MMADHPLDRSIWHALSHRHTAFARGDAGALRYAAEYAPFGATRDDSPASLAGVRCLVPQGGRVALFTRERLEFPHPLAVLRRAEVAQMVLRPDALSPGMPGLPATTRRPGDEDVPAMMALTALTQPGPFAERTIALGDYLGIFAGERLIAMAGERFCLDGFVEISAVCTDPAHRGQGFAAALIAALAGAAFERGETPFLHAFTENTAALSVYRRLGFSTRARLHLAVVGHAEA